MNFIIAYIISVLLSIVMVLTALSVKIVKIGLHGKISSKEASFIYLATITTIVPGLNLVAAGCCLYKVLRG